MDMGSDGAGTPVHGRDVPDDHLRLLLDRVIAGEVAEIDEPHIVLIRDEHTTCYEGPYPDALSALVAAEAERATVAPRDATVVSVAPLHRPSGLGPAE